jgi:two-component system, NtrC family, sensor kinase
MERRMQHNDRLVILGEITAGIAHELNTPLANILGFSQLIQDRAADEQVKKDIEKIINATIYSREVVKKLMFFSSEMPHQMQLTAINPFIEDAIKLLGPSLHKEQVSLHFEPDPRNPSIQIDRVQMTQVLFNLLINALHASSQGKVIRVNVNSDGKILRMSIIDEGHGIPEAIKERVFEPFFSTKAIGEGVGLGLSVVHGIIKSHKGTITLKSEADEGTIFTISLPLNQ